MDTARSIFQSAKLFFAGTALSRVSGLIRDISMAFCFGSAPEIASFMVAYRVANLFRRLFGEGNLQAGFVPHFEILRGEHLRTAFVFYRDAVFSLLVTVGLVTVCFESVLHLSTRFLDDSWKEMIFYTMWMAPGLLFICLSSLNTALLQCQKCYFLPSMAPVLFNAMWVVSAVVVSGFPIGEAIRLLSIGVMLAFAAQWGVTAVRVRREVKEYLDWKAWLRPHIFSPEWKKLVHPMFLGIIGVGAMQVNSALDALFARFADPSGPAYLWYAIRVQQMPLALFGLALSGALLPPLSRAIREGAVNRYCDLLHAALLQSARFMVPSTFGLFVLGASGLNLLYGRGAFTSEAIQQTLLCLWAYSLGVVPAVFVLLLATGCYATKKYDIPTVASLISVGGHFCLNVLFIFGLHLGAVSVALATSASSWVNFALLTRMHKIENSFWIDLAKITLMSAIAGGATLLFGVFLGDGTIEICRRGTFSFPRVLTDQLLPFLGMGGFYLIFIFWMSWLLEKK